jgi:hypothetical protein
MVGVRAKKERGQCFSQSVPNSGYIVYMLQYLEIIGDMYVQLNPMRNGIHRLIIASGILR